MLPSLPSSSMMDDFLSSQQYVNDNAASAASWRVNVNKQHVDTSMQRQQLVETINDTRSTKKTKKTKKKDSNRVAKKNKNKDSDRASKRSKVTRAVAAANAADNNGAIAFPKRTSEGTDDDSSDESSDDSEDDNDIGSGDEECPSYEEFHNIAPAASSPLPSSSSSIPAAAAAASSIVPAAAAAPATPHRAVTVRRKRGTAAVAAAAAVAVPVLTSAQLANNERKKVQAKLRRKVRFDSAKATAGPVAEAVDYTLGHFLFLPRNANAYAAEYAVMIGSAPLDSAGSNEKDAYETKLRAVHADVARRESLLPCEQRVYRMAIPQIAKQATKMQAELTKLNWVLVALCYADGQPCRLKTPDMLHAYGIGDKGYPPAINSVAVAHMQSAMMLISNHKVNGMSVAQLDAHIGVMAKPSVTDVFNKDWNATTRRCIKSIRHAIVNESWIDVVFRNLTPAEIATNSSSASSSSSDASSGLAWTLRAPARFGYAAADVDTTVMPAHATKKKKKQSKRKRSDAEQDVATVADDADEADDADDDDIDMSPASAVQVPDHRDDQISEQHSVISELQEQVRQQQVKIDLHQQIEQQLMQQRDDINLSNQHHMQQYRDNSNRQYQDDCNNQYCYQQLIQQHEHTIQQRDAQIHQQQQAIQHHEHTIRSQHEDDQLRRQQQIDDQSPLGSPVDNNNNVALHTWARTSSSPSPSPSPSPLPSSPLPAASRPSSSLPYNIGMTTMIANAFD